MKGPLPPSKCPTCHYEMDTGTSPLYPKAKPRPGDLSVCLGCGELLTYDENLLLRFPLLIELVEITPDVSAQIFKIQRIIRKMRPPVTRK